MYLNKLILKTLEVLKFKYFSFKEFLIFLFKRAQGDTIFRVASSLSYTSLIAIVPLIAIGLAIFSAFPVFQGIKDQLQTLALQHFVPTFEQEVSKYFTDFISATAKLTAIGVIGIVITAILMLSTIENSLNFIFKVHRSRSIKTKITLYWTVITLGPLLVGTAISLRGYFYTLRNFVPHAIIDSHSYLSTLLPSLFTILALVLLYVMVPNKKVKISYAFIGAITSMVMFLILRKFFGLVFSASGTYTTLYGAMATLPILLIWIYFSWAVVLFGAILTASLGEFSHLERKAKNLEKHEIYKKNNNNEKKHLHTEQK